MASWVMRFFINNADSNSSSSSSSNDSLGVLLEAPLGAYRRLKISSYEMSYIEISTSEILIIELWKSTVEIP